MLVIKPHSAAASRFSTADFNSFTRVHYHSASFISSNKYRRCDGRVKSRDGIKAAAKEQSGSGSGPLKQNTKPQRYHPLEEIAESELLKNKEPRLSPAEITRTIIEVNSKATLMFSSLVNGGIHENIFWPDISYVTDEHGNIYLQVKNDEDILRALTAEETIVQVIVGLDTTTMIGEMDSLGHSEIDFGIDELENEESDFDDDGDDDYEDEDNGEDEDNNEKDWVSILDKDDQDEDSDESLGDWANLETMRSVHPMYFAQKLAEVVLDDPVDCMDRPSAGVALRGLLRPAFVEDHTNFRKHISGPESSYIDANHIVDEQMQEGTVEINGRRKERELAQDNTNWAEEMEDETLGNAYVFYKLEMVKIQLVSSHGDQNCVELENFRRAGPDAIAHSTVKIISRLKAGGEKTLQALKSLCWRCKGIQVEECALVGVDSLGFDLRVCSGRQVQTLRFPFKKPASSEYGAERQLNGLLFSYGP